MTVFVINGLSRVNVLKDFLHNFQVVISHLQHPKWVVLPLIPAKWNGHLFDQWELTRLYIVSNYKIVIAQNQNTEQ